MAFYEETNGGRKKKCTSHKNIVNCTCPRSTLMKEVLSYELV